MSNSSLSASQSLPCVLCGRQDDCPEKFGEKKTYSEHDLTLHYYCLLMSSGIWQRGEEDEGVYGFLVSDIKKEITRARRLRCSVCKMTGASIGCVIPRCKRSYHYPCGVERKCIFQFTESFRTYCWDHRPVQNVPLMEKDSSLPCTICLEPVEPRPSYDVLCSPCCKTAWLHRECLQYQALSAGLFFFRCSMCNNKDKFQREMLRMGIHIPERDASWELEENAFQELLVRYQRCDVRKCYCRSGREYNEPDSEWEIFLCQCCGSSGTHRACSSLQQLVQSWECSECQSIVYTPGKDKRSHLGVEQPSPKCPRPSTSPRSKVQFRQIQPRIMPLVDILQELRQQINRDSVCTLCVKKRSFWSTSVKGFRKGSFSPSRTLQVKFTESNPRDANLPQQMPVAEFFKLLLSTLENSSLFEGSEHKNISLNLDAQSDNLYYEAGRMIAVSLVHGGPAPGFFSHTLFSCLANEPQHVQPVLEDVADPNVAQAILTIQSCRTIAKLKSVIINYLDYLLETDNLQLVQSVSDKFLLIKQILAHHVIRRVQAPLESFKEGMKTLGVLEKIQAYPSSFWSILCLKPEKLTSKIMLDLFTIKFNIHICPDKRNEVTSFWADYLEDSEEGTAANSLEEILRFATGLDSIPPAGFEPQPCIEFSNGTVPTSRKWANCIHLPVFSNYSEFQRSMDQAIGASRIA
ncbi:G2/M phase-specific E3 ubiquitin-protein ligase [Bombina bombina]|uniref:G2/M phase-specific E3 ubiquitin-protein ligase n=1 Tax=Bombina bombina TaxID=8345 RepID=UPI00235AB704|nr:G2/M phase-specific E3 ubiquitin-protein ligase [Bombina bombina]XP_053553915.1 G2/M phase-specific E3 ubiquitin-protein ligase [Bombina bombina]